MYERVKPKHGYLLDGILAAQNKVSVPPSIQNKIFCP